MHLRRHSKEVSFRSGVSKCTLAPVSQTFMGMQAHLFTDAFSEPAPMLQLQKCVAVTDTRESEKLQQLFTSQPFVEEDR